MSGSVVGARVRFDLPIEGMWSIVDRKGQLKRLCMASFVVLAIVVTPPLSAYASDAVGMVQDVGSLAFAIVGRCMDAAISGSTDEVSLGGASEEETAANSALGVALAESYGATAGAQAVSEEFREECLELENAWDVVSLDGGSLVGYSVGVSSDQAFAQVKDELVGKNWTWADSGRDDAGTFVKSTGKYRWLFVTCVEVAGETSVVVQVEKGSA